MDNLNATPTTSRESPDHANTEGTKTAVAQPLPPPPVAPEITGLSAPTEPVAPNAAPAPSAVAPPPAAAPPAPAAAPTAPSTDPDANKPPWACGPPAPSSPELPPLPACVIARASPLPGVPQTSPQRIPVVTQALSLIHI